MDDTPAVGFSKVNPRLDTEGEGVGGSRKLPIRPELWVALFLVALILLVYGQVYHFQFISLDDPLYITSNARILKGLTWDSVRYAFTSWEDGSYLPLVWLSHAACVSLFGLNAGGHHLVNVAFHIANSVLLFFLLRTLTKSFWPSAFVALLFALHPLHVESVAWVSERKDVLSTFFWILTTWTYVGYVRQPSMLRYLGMTFLFVLGLLSKSMLVTLPLTLLLFDFWPLQRIEIKNNSIKLIIKNLFKLILEKVPLITLSIVAGVITILSSRSIDALAIQGKGSHPLFVRMGNALVAMVKYLQLTIWPMNLSPYYPHPGSQLSHWSVIFSLVLILGISAVCIFQARQRPFLIVGWLWFVITLLPVIGILQVGMQAYADRYTYVPLTGLFLMVAWLGQEVTTRWTPPRVLLLGIPAALIGVLLSLTAAQVYLWRGSFTLFGHALSLDPNNGMALAKLGDVYWKEGQLQNAYNSFIKANKNMPGVYWIQLKIGGVLNLMGRNEEALDHIWTAHTWRPDHVIANQMLGSTLISMGRYDEAEAYIVQVLQAKASHSTAVKQSEALSIKTSRSDWGIILRARHRLPEAVESLEATLAQDPEFGPARMELGLTQSELGRHDEAIANIKRVLNVEPNNPKALDALGVVLTNAGLITEARKVYEKLLELDPQSPLAGKWRQAQAGLNTASEKKSLKVTPLR